ncbi:TraR/DksA family transcriptional regulator [Calditrichota bacterium LG25]
MNKKDLERFKNIILGKKEEVIKNLEYLRSTILDSTTREATGDHSAYSFHMADQGTDNMEREKAFLFAARDEKYLKQLDMALERIENGTYGICRVCRKEIDHKRLEAVPTTTICFDCKVAESGR